MDISPDQVDLDALLSMPDPEKLALGRAVAARLGAGWTADDELYSLLPSVCRDGLPYSFAFVPRCTLALGLTRQDEATLRQRLGAEAEVVIPALQRGATATSVRTVGPFLFADTTVLFEDAVAWLGDFEERQQPLLGDGHAAFLSAGEVARVLARFAGVRLPTDDEWETVAREGGAVGFVNDCDRAWESRFLQGTAGGISEENGLGILGLELGEWVGSGEPTTFRGGAFRSWPWQSRGELMFGACARRGRATDGFARHAMRFACSLPEPHGRA